MSWIKKLAVENGGYKIASKELSVVQYFWDLVSLSPDDVILFRLICSFWMVEGVFSDPLPCRTETKAFWSVLM